MSTISISNYAMRSASWKEGFKVKAYVHFRGRSIVFKERGELLLLKFLQELDDHGAAEDLPRMEGRRMHVIVSPKKGKKK